MKMESDAVEIDYSCLRSRLVHSKALLELSVLCTDPSGNLVVAPKKLREKNIVVIFRGHIEIHGEFGYMYDFFSIDQKLNEDSLFHYVEETLKSLLKGDLQYLYLLAEGGGLLSGAMLAIDEIDEFLGLGYQVYFLG